ncbi:pyridoxal phosphate-dependent transferase [Chytridium lagenaria]|nr:pyridoxal phosphate-dependent transferase [Chytridium lagenaria]
MSISVRAADNLRHKNILAVGAIRCGQNAFDVHANTGGVINLGTAENKITGDLLVEKLNQPGAFKVKPTTLLYGSFKGSRELRNELDPVVPLVEDHIAIANGAGSVLCMLSQAIADPGDVILIPSPVYGAFFWDFRSVGRVESVFVPGPASVPSLEDLTAAYDKCTREGKKVRGLVITNPGNPTGQVLPIPTVKAWLKWAAERGIHSIVDEVYVFSIWAKPEDDGYEEFESVLHMDDLPDRALTHVVWSFSKDFAMSGMRCAALITYNEEVMRGFTDLAYFHGVPNVVDEAIARLLQDKLFVDHFLATNNDRLRSHFALVANELTKRNIPFLRPNAGIFVWLNLSQWTSRLEEGSIDPDSGEKKSRNMVLFEKLLDNNVYITPSEAFFASEQQGWFRIIFTSGWDILDIAFARIFNVLDQIQ